MKHSRNIPALRILMFMAAVVPAGLQASGETSAKINVSIRAICSVTFPPQLILGGLPVAEIIQPGGENGLTRYAKTLTLITRCTEASEYRITFKAQYRTARGCAEAQSGEMAFCLYHNDRLIDLNEKGGGSLTGKTDHAEELLQVMPARGSKNAVAGEYSASVTVMVEVK